MSEQQHTHVQATLQITLDSLKDIDQAEDRNERIHRSTGAIRYLLGDLASSALFSAGERALLKSINDLWYHTIYGKRDEA
jgi:hypothetical protein